MGKRFAIVTGARGADGGGGPGNAVRSSGARRVRRLLLLGSAAVACLLAPSMASASTLAGGPNPRITAGAGEQNQIVLSRSGEDVVITDTAGITESTAECDTDNPNQISCDDTAGNWQFLAVELKDMNDRLTVEPMEAFFGVNGGGLSTDGGSGDDRLDFTNLGGLDAIGHATGGRDTVSAWGGAGDDTLIGSQGGNLFDGSNRSGYPPDPNYDAGNDTLIGGPVADRLVGGQGVDFLDGRDGPDEIFGLVVDNQSSTTTDDRAADTLFCGPGAVNPDSGLADVAQAGVGDAVGTDCEAVFQKVVCPPTGATCDGTPQVTTTVATAASGSAAASARTRRRKVVLGRALGGEMRVKSGRSTSVYIPLRKRRVRRALGRRRRMTVTFSQNFDRLKKGRKVGEANRRKRFKMRRR
jgi:Ca2+-binding RTX toxin-like protein